MHHPLQMAQSRMDYMKDFCCPLTVYNTKFANITNYSKSIDLFATISAKCEAAADNYFVIDAHCVWPLIVDTQTLKYIVFDVWGLTSQNAKAKVEAHPTNKLQYTHIDDSGNTTLMLDHQTAVLQIATILSTRLPQFVSATESEEVLSAVDGPASRDRV